MASPNRKRVAVRAPGHAWAQLGELLVARRVELGYQYRPEFSRERGLNARRVADIENNYRPDTYPNGSLREIANAYQVTYESILAVLAGDAQALTPVTAAAPAEPAGWVSPITDEARERAARPYADRIWEQLRQLAAAGVTEPDGAAVFPGSPADAQTWDGIGARMDLPDRVWLIADLQRRAYDRQGRTPGTAGDAAAR